MSIHVKRFNALFENENTSNEEIHTAYSQEADMTFILKHQAENGVDVSIEVIGFYFGQPNEESTKQHQNSLRADLG